jgi:hypothetical protein
MAMVVVRLILRRSFQRYLPAAAGQQVFYLHIGFRAVQGLVSKCTGLFALNLVLADFNGRR